MPINKFFSISINAITDLFSFGLPSKEQYEHLLISNSVRGPVFAQNNKFLIGFNPKTFSYHLRVWRSSVTKKICIDVVCFNLFVKISLKIKLTSHARSGEIRSIEGLHIFSKITILIIL